MYDSVSKADTDVYKRQTKQRKLILDYIDKKNEPLSGQAIYDDLKKEMAIDLSTVYRLSLIHIFLFQGRLDFGFYL